MARESLPVPLDRRSCPVCQLRNLPGRWVVCPRCGTHGRSLDQSVTPIGQVWYVFLPLGRYEISGWAEMTALGFKMVHDESTTPTRPREEFARTREDDQASAMTEREYERAGARGRPL